MVKRVYIETSGKEQYLPTRKFFIILAIAFLEAELKDFYAPDDSKLIFLKELK